MKKDIEISVSKEVFVALIYDWDDKYLSKGWTAYILNNRTSPIEMVLVVSKGYDDERKTSTMRHSVGDVASKSFEKIEFVQDAVLALENEFFVTFFADNKLYERRFLFKKDSVNTKGLRNIPLIDKEGIYAI